MKKLLSLLLALVATTCLWAYNFKSGDLYYNITSSSAPYTVEVTSKSSSYPHNNGVTFTSATIPEFVTYNGNTYSVTRIGYGAFYDCSSLTSVTIPNSVTSIETNAFRNCQSLTSITIPNSVTSIGSYAFDGCFSLTSITIPNSVTSIWSRAFSYCSSLTSIVVESGNTTYDSRDNCNAIVETTTNTLIVGCQSTIIPESVTSIGNYAFCGCSGLTSITIPNSVTSIGSRAFSYCSFLTSIVVESGNTTYDSRDNCNAIVKTTTNLLIVGCQSTIIPESVTRIGNYAFCGCSGLTSITIPNSVTNIGDEAFSDCSGLTSITIGNSVKSIGNGAFAYCSALTSITIPNSVTSIRSCAFYGCSGLTSITIPNSVTSIGDYAFEYCSSLTSITCEATTPPTLGSDVFYKVSKSIPVYVPCGCVSAYKAAKYWMDYTNIQEPQAEYSIQVDTSNSQMGSAKVDYNTFCDGNQISATANYGYHFVQWSDGVTDNPRTLILTQDTILTAEFAQSYSGQCGDNLYWSYDEMTKIISITGSGNMYDYTADTQPWVLFKEQIVKVTTSNTATSIGTSAFEGCVRLSEVTVGPSITDIAANTFAECNRLYHIYCYPTYPPFAKQSSFANYNVYLHVPCDYKEGYNLDVVWGNFKYIECLGAESENTNGVVITPTTNDVTIIWPTETGADTYTIIIKKGNEVFCTLTFNANGQLLNIAFAPGRNGNHPVQYAEQAGNAYRFTVTGLEEGTHYTYNIDVRDAADKTIKSYTGEFTTESMTAIENITTNNVNIQKILRDGQLLILRDGVEYTIMGQEL